MKILFTTLLLPLTFFCFAQGSFRAVLNNRANSLLTSKPSSLAINKFIQLNDGSFVGVGVLDSLTNEFFQTYDSKGFMIRISEQGSFISEQTIGALPSDLIKTSDGGFLILVDNYLLYKFDANAALQWQKTFGFDNSYFRSYLKIRQLKDNGYLLARSNGYDFIELTRMDSSGIIQWTKKYFNYVVDPLSPVVPQVVLNDFSTDDYGAVCLATSNNTKDRNNTDTTYLFRVDLNGNVKWAKYMNGTFHSYSTDFPKSIATSADGLSYVVQSSFFDGSSISYNTPNQILLTKIDTSGNIIWYKTNDTIGKANFIPSRILSESDGGYLFAGTMQALTRDFFPDASNTFHTAYLIKMNTNGQPVWTKVVSELTDSLNREYWIMMPGDFIKTRDNGYSFSALKEKFIGGGYGFERALFKTDASLDFCGGTLPYGGLQDFAGTATSVQISSANGAVIVSRDTLVNPVNHPGEDSVYCPASVLPVHLLSFTAALQNNGKVAIAWKTTGEDNTAYYVVQRSNNRTAFTDLQQVKAGGNNSGVNTYTSSDNTPLPGTSYYRLQQVSTDGKITYSSIATVTADNNGMVVIAPNPVHSSVNIRIQSHDAGTVTLQVTDLSGKILSLKQVVVTQGTNSVTLPAASLLQGTYVLKVLASNGGIQRLKFVKN